MVALLLGMTSMLALPAGATPVTERASLEPNAIRLAAADTERLHVQLISDTPAQLEDTQRAPAPSVPTGLRILAEVGTGFLGELAFTMPGVWLGESVSGYFVDATPCTTGHPPDPGQCFEDASNAAWSRVGVPIVGLAIGLGSGLGVLLAGAVTQSGGNGWLTLAGGLASAGLAVLVLAGSPATPLLTFPIALAGAILCHELSRPSQARASREPAPAVRVTPSVALLPGGGAVGVTGRF